VLVSEFAKITNGGEKSSNGFVPRTGMISKSGTYFDRSRVYLRYRINSWKAVPALEISILLLSRGAKPSLAASVWTAARLLSKILWGVLSASSAYLLAVLLTLDLVSHSRILSMIGWVLPLSLPRTATPSAHRNGFTTSCQSSGLHQFETI
jgi:hypothetical protein